MPDKVTIDVIPQVREAVFDLVSSYPKAKRGCRYADIRIEASEGKVAVAENGMDKFSGEDYGFAFGVRVIAGDRVTAPGYAGEMVGSSDLPRLNQRLREALDHAYERATANARAKEGTRSRLWHSRLRSRGRHPRADRRPAGHNRCAVRDGPA